MDKALIEKVTGDIKVQVNYRLPTGLIESINGSVLTLGVKNNTQAAITLLEQALAINTLSSSIKDKIYNSLVESYQDISAQEVRVIMKALGV